MTETPAPKWIDPVTTMIGKHNADLPAATLRILEGGSWKDQSTVIVMPAAKMVPMKCVLSWMMLVKPPNMSIPPLGLMGMEVGHAYSEAVAFILANEVLKKHRFILTLEHDNLPPPDGLLRLLRAMEAHPEYAAIGGLYWTKGPLGVPQIWGDPTDPIVNFRPQPPRVGELVECCGTGMGFTLFRTEMFRDERLAKPWFKTEASEQGSSTQDLTFWMDARKYGYRCAIDCGCLVGHHDANEGVTW